MSQHLPLTDKYVDRIMILASEMREGPMQPTELTDIWIGYLNNMTHLEGTTKHTDASVTATVMLTENDPSKAIRLNQCIHTCKNMMIGYSAKDAMQFWLDHECPTKNHKFEGMRYKTDGSLVDESRGMNIDTNNHAYFALAPYQKQIAWSWFSDVLDVMDN